jgi:hypothetical protein
VTFSRHERKSNLPSKKEITPMQYARLVVVLSIFVAGGLLAQSAPVVDAGADVSEHLPQAELAIFPPSDHVVLTGAVSDDGQPNPHVLTVSWSQESGPAVATLRTDYSNPSAPVAALRFGVCGTYVFKLTASDGELTSSDMVTVVMEHYNLDAGPNRDILITDAANLDGTFIGWPTTQVEWTSLEYKWSLVSGPGTVSVDAQGQSDTKAAFSAAGVYFLNLRVIATGTYSFLDSGSFNFTDAYDDTVRVVVSGSGTPPALDNPVRLDLQSNNNPPSVTSPLPSETQTAPAGQEISFTVAATDPDGDPVSYIWNFGDGIGHTAGTSSNHTFLTPGVYTVEVYAFDGQLTVSAGSTVVVVTEVIDLGTVSLSTKKGRVALKLPVPKALKNKSKSKLTKGNTGEGVKYKNFKLSGIATRTGTFGFSVAVKQSDGTEKIVSYKYTVVE